MLWSQLKSIPEIEDNNLQALSLEAIQLRFEILLNQSAFDELMKSKRPYSSMDIQTINKLAMKHIKFGKKSMRFINHYKSQLSTIELDEELSKNSYKNIVTALALGLTISDTFLLAYDQFHNNKKLRKILNERDYSINKEKNIFKESISDFYSFNLRKKMLKSIKIYNKFQFPFKTLEKTSPVINRAKNIIQNSYTFKLIQQDESHFSKKRNLLLKKIRNKKIRVLDSIVQLTNKTLFYGSKAFGNLAGLVQLRRGKLYYNQNFFQDIYPRLRPLDILLEKTPFRLTDQFIPGYWGHAAIYIGNKTDLQELGIWDHPIVKKFHPDIL